MMRFCAVFSNNGFLGIPLTKAVFKNLPAEIFAEGITAILEALDEGDYGMKPATVRFTLGSTILSIITIPVIYGILNLFI